MTATDITRERLSYDAGATLDIWRSASLLLGIARVRGRLDVILTTARPLGLPKRRIVDLRFADTRETHGEHIRSYALTALHQAPHTERSIFIVLPGVQWGLVRQYQEWSESHGRAHLEIASNIEEAGSLVDLDLSTWPGLLEDEIDG
jgi:hypothetical protein